MTDRLILTLGIALALALAWAALRLYLGHRKQVLLASTGRTALPPASVGRPTLLYLYTTQCGQCRQQARTVDTLQARLGDAFRVRRLDALTEPDLAARYEVRTVPTTVVLDASGQARAINYGLAALDLLERQIRQVAGE